MCTLHTRYTSRGYHFRRGRSRFHVLMSKEECSHVTNTEESFTVIRWHSGTGPLVGCFAGPGPNDVERASYRRMINDLWYKNAIVYCLSVST